MCTEPHYWRARKKSDVADFGSRAKHWATSNPKVESGSATSNDFDGKLDRISKQLEGQTSI